MIIAIPDQPATLPAALTALDQWVAWKYVPDHKNPNKPKKLPFCPFLQDGKVTPAKSNDPTTWGGYEEAVAFAAEHSMDGVGFVFSKDDAFAGGDLDGCLDPATGAVAEWAAPLLEQLLAVAYVEVSPSRTGLKFVVRGELVKALNKKKLFGAHQGIELYDWGRYFTITGLMVEGSQAEPLDGQAIIDELVATYDPPATAPTLPTASPPPALPAADAPVAAGWRGDRARAVDARLRDWVADCLEWARQEMRGATPGELHTRRLQLGRFLGGVIGAAPSLLSDDEALAILFGAKVPASHHSQEMRAIRDGLNTGRGLPLTPGAVGEKDGRDFLPTDAELVVTSGRACCPTCRTPVRRSKYDYPGSTVPGWYCPQCKWPMQWPLTAWSGGEVAQLAQQSAPSPTSPSEASPRYRWLVGDEIDQIRMPRWLVRGYMALGGVTVVWGPSESGKTPLLVDIVERVSHYHTVIYVAAEDAAGLRARMRAWELHHQVARGALIVQPEAIPLGDDLAVELFIAQARPYAPRLIVIDTLNPCIIGLDENSNSDMGVVAVRLVRIAEQLDCQVAVLHHPTKDGATLRGASALLNNTSAIWYVEKGGDDLITVRQTRNKQGGRRDDRHFRIKEQPIDMVDDQGKALTSVVLLPAAKVTRRDRAITKQERELLALIVDAEAAGEPIGTADLMEACGVNRKQPGSFYRMVKHLKEDCGYIEKGDRKSAPFTATDAGRRVLTGAAIAREAEPDVDTPWEIAASIEDGVPTPVALPTPADRRGPDLGPGYAGVEGYDAPLPEEPPAELWAGDGGAEPEPEPGPSVAQGLYERLSARKGATRAAAD